MAPKESFLPEQDGSSSDFRWTDSGAPDPEEASTDSLATGVFPMDPDLFDAVRHLEVEELPPGTSFGPFVTRRLLGRGGMGIVYLAEQSFPPRQVALKLLLQRARPEAAERFRREIELAGALRHENIVPVLAAGSSGGVLYYAMEYVDGVPYSRRIPYAGLPVGEVLSVVVQVGRALAHAHKRGVLHRDVKPGNMMVKDRPDGLVAYLVDFGLARATHDERLTDAGQVLGSPAYMAPEALVGSERADTRTDLYGLGGILYHALTGRPPVALPSIECVRAFLEEGGPGIAAPRSIRPDLPPDLEAICLRLLARDVEARYQTADEALDDLERLRAGEPLCLGASTFVRHARRSLHRHGRALAGAALAAGVVLASAGWSHVRMAEAYEAAMRARVEAVQSAAAADRRVEALGKLEAARSALEEARSLLYDADAEVATVHARADESRRWIEAALDLDPTLPIGHYLLGRAWSLAGRGDLAESAWTEALRLDEGLASAHLELGILLLERSARRRNLEQNWGAKGLREDSARLAERAGRHLQRAVSLGLAVDRGAYETLVVAFQAHLREDWPTLESACVRGLSEYPDWLGRESFELLLGAVQGPAEIVAACDRALAIRPKYALALLVKAGRVGPERRVEALALLEECIAVEPGESLAHFARAMLLREEHRLAEALRATEDALAIDPEDPLARLGRGLVLCEEGRIEESWNDLVAAGRSIDGYELRAASSVVCACRSDLVGAIEHAEAAIRFRPDLWVGYDLRAMAARRGGEWARAEADYVRALELGGGGICRLFLEMSRFLSGRVPEAIEGLERCVRDGVAEAWFYVGLVRASSGDVAGGTAAHREALGRPARTLGCGAGPYVAAIDAYEAASDPDAAVLAAIGLLQEVAADDDSIDAERRAGFLARAKLSYEQALGASPDPDLRDRILHRPRMSGR